MAHVHVNDISLAHHSPVHAPSSDPATALQEVSLSDESLASDRSTPYQEFIS